MVLDTASIHLESREQSSGHSLAEQQTTAAMDPGNASGLKNGYTNSAFAADGDGGLRGGIPGSAPVDFGVDAALYRTTSPKRNVVSPALDEPPAYRKKSGAAQGTAYPAPDGESCGYWCWMPRCLQTLATGRYFVLFCSLLSLTEAGLTIGYISSVVTSIERNFNFSSTLIGFIVSCYDIGTLLVVLTSYYGGRANSNRPKWIAWSAWVMSLGACIVPLSHFATENYAVGAGRDNATESLVCPASGPAAPTTSPLESEGDCTGTQEPVLHALWFLIPGMLLIGAGSTSMFTLGTTYIDDYVRKNESPILLAIFFCTTVIGPGVGFVVGYSVLGLYVDFNVGSPEDLGSGDPDWLGAWWLGFFICAGTIAVTAVPVYAFPARLPKPDPDYGTPKAGGGADRPSSGNSGPVMMAFGQVSLKHIPGAVLRLLKNPIYMMINIASAVEFSIVTGFVRFSPKFIEYQFNLSASTANLVTGTLVPVGAIGVVIGGIILNRVKNDLSTTINVLCFFTITSGLLYGFVFIPGPCPSLSLAGVTSPYVYSDSSWERPSDPNRVDLTSSCNTLCGCDDWDYIPICGANGVTYFSACHAGCVAQHELPPNVEAKTGRDLVNYTNCSCIESYVPQGGNNSTNEALRSSLRSRGVEVFYDGVTFTYAVQSLDSGITGQCTEECTTIIPFICLLLLVVCVTSVVQMPALMTTLRCVSVQERPFALGLQFVIIRLLGYIPAPIYYGATIDNACVLWQRTCSDRKGSCLEYDNERYYYNYLVLSTGLKMISVTMAVTCWFVVRRKYGTELAAQSGEADSDQAADSEAGRSTMSLSTNLGDPPPDQTPSSNSIAVISNFKLESTRDTAVMDSVLS